MYDPQIEKERILESLIEMTNQTPKEAMLQKAIAFANDEFDEFQHEFQVFLDRVSNLNVYQELIGSKFEKGARLLIEQAKYLIERTYTEDELENMQDNEYAEVLIVQSRRKEVLRKIVKTYLR